MDNNIIFVIQPDPEQLFYDKIYRAIEEMQGMITVTQINGILHQIMIEMIVIED